MIFPSKYLLKHLHNSYYSLIYFFFRVNKIMTLNWDSELYLPKKNVCTAIDPHNYLIKELYALSMQKNKGLCKSD